MNTPQPASRRGADWWREDRGIPHGVSRLMVVTPESEEQAVGTINVTADDFKTTIDDNDIVLVDWWASWCGPCRMFAPVFEKASAEHPDIVFAKIDT